MRAVGKRTTPDFAEFSSQLLGLPVNHVWQGYCSAIFLELGALQPNPRKRRVGTWRNPVGEWTLGIEWSWRIEGKRRIWCGSWSDKERWPRALSRLEGARVTSVSVFGRLPEISVSFSNGLHLLSMMTAEGDPEWSLTKREEPSSATIYVRAGRLQIDTRENLPRQ
jgi:hypothetical protein